MAASDKVADIVIIFHYVLGYSRMVLKCPGMSWDVLGCPGMVLKWIWDRPGMVLGCPGMVLGCPGVVLGCPGVVLGCPVMSGPTG